MLLELHATAAVKKAQLPLATVVTPNHYVPEHLLGKQLDTAAALVPAAHQH